MLHGPAVKDETPDHASGYKAHLGVILFVIYAFIYGVFVTVSVLDVTIMETQIAMGLNLAVVFGFGLIIVALIMALFYNALCSSKEKLLNTASAKSEGGK